MFRALIVDDEELARKELREILTEAPEIEIIGEAANGLQAVEQITRLQPDIVFLDIEMPGLNGFEVVNAVNSPPEIIFVTAYDHYAVQAFEINAVDYLLKPVSPDRVRKAITRFCGEGRPSQSAEEQTRQQMLLSMQIRNPSCISRIAAYKGPNISLVNIADIITVKVEEKLVFIYTKTGRFIINKTISEMEQFLSLKDFFRINRSTLLNLNYLSEIIPWFSGTYKLKLDTGEELSLSRERVRKFKETVGLSNRLLRP
jgi:DNA-binding LytR/AlgR family response regulator